MFFKKKAFKKVPPGEDMASIGNLAIELGYITSVVLEDALKIQKRRLKLGEILIGIGAITRGQLEELLFEQRLRRERVSKMEIIKHEERKRRHRFQELEAVFKDATSHADKFIAAIKVDQLPPVKS